MNQGSRPDPGFYSVITDRDRSAGEMIDLKIALMIIMIGILLFAVYFTAIPG